MGIFLRWAEIQAFLDEHHSTDLLRHHFTDPIEVLGRPLTGRRSRQPLLCPIDRWGHLPYGEPMTAQSVSALVRAYLSERPPVLRNSQGLISPLPSATEREPLRSVHHDRSTATAPCWA